MNQGRRILSLLCALVLVGFLALTSAIPVQSGELSMTAIMYGNANEGTWDPALYESLLKAQKGVGFKLHINETTGHVDLEKALRNWAGRDVSYIHAHSGSYIEETLKVAGHFPKVHFSSILNSDPREYEEYVKYRASNTPPNVLLIGHTPYEANYLAGCAAALASKTGKIGILQPFDSREMNRFTNSVYFGAKAARPDIKVRTVLIGNYVAPAETRDAVKSLAQQDCDVVFALLDDNSAILESAVQGIYCIPTYKDRHDINPKTVLTSVHYDWSAQFEGPMKALQAGKFEDYRQKHYFRAQSMAEGSIDLGQWGEGVPDSLKEKVAEMRAKIIDGRIKMQVSAESIKDRF